MLKHDNFAKIIEVENGQVLFLKTFLDTGIDNIIPIISILINFPDALLFEITLEYDNETNRDSAFNLIDYSVASGALRQAQTIIEEQLVSAKSSIVPMDA